ncbi:proteasome subunit beta type-11-like [Engraulis encrasicolus]|uniref:proteasome subunit beta type-11-like n=1 Tax=Engraulis encrasicolus TaxID=184585 RepID=UPI002FD4EDEB
MASHCFLILSKSPKSNDPISTHHPSPGSPRPPASVAAPFRLCHGTTTLAFAFQGGVIAAADSRASAGGLVACPAVEKISPIHSHLVVTSSGSGADCMLWERILTREIRLYQLRHGRRLSVGSSAKLLSLMLHPFKGTDVCVALTLCGWDTVGQRLCYVCSDGAFLKGELFSVGSGSPYAYSVLDGSVRWEMCEEEAVSVAREAVYRATHRDAYSGNSVDLYHVTERGWRRRPREDLREECEVRSSDRYQSQWAAVMPISRLAKMWGRRFPVDTHFTEPRLQLVESLRPGQSGVDVRVIRSQAGGGIRLSFILSICSNSSNIRYPQLGICGPAGMGAEEAVWEAKG